MPTSASITRVLALGLALTFACTVAKAQRIDDELASRLTEAQTRAYILHLRARARHERETDAYWTEVERLKDRRRQIRASRRHFTADDFMRTQPPKFDGPPIPSDVAKIIATLRPAEAAEPSEPMADVSDFLRHARRIYGFVPKAIPEAEFMRRYASEALALGLSKDQVVRVYALETGGRGTADMQAGIDPETKKGRPISSALGYAQLLGANSVDELVKHGPAFIHRLTSLAARSGGKRRAELLAKARVLRRMLNAARSVPNRWSAHVAFSRTPRGLGIHALNLDGDIGPWLQTVKLRGIRDYAEKAGRPRLSGAEIELMNLAGPQTGLDMMDPVGRTMPTANFFAEAAYKRNPMVQGRSGAELLAALEDRMNHNLRKPGSIAFAKVFDEMHPRRVRAAER